MNGEKLSGRHVSWWRDRRDDKARIEFASKHSLVVHTGVVVDVQGRNVKVEGGDWMWIPDLEACIARGDP